MESRQERAVACYPIGVSSMGGRCRNWSQTRFFIAAVDAPTSPPDTLYSLLVWCVWQRVVGVEDGEDAPPIMEIREWLDESGKQTSVDVTDLGKV